MTAVPNPNMERDLWIDLGEDPTEERLTELLQKDGWTLCWLPIAFGQPIRVKLSRPVDKYVTKTITSSGWTSHQALTEAAWTVFCTMIGQKS